MSQVHPQRTLPEGRSALPEAVQEPRHGRVFPAGVQAQRAVRLSQQRPVLGARPLRVPCRLLVLMQGVDGGVGVRQVGVGRVLALGVRQRGLRVRRGKVGWLEVGGRRVAEWGGGRVRGLVQRGQLGEAPPGRGDAQSVRALLHQIQSARGQQWQGSVSAFLNIARAPPVIFKHENFNASFQRCVRTTSKTINNTFINTNNFWKGVGVYL